MLLQQDQPDTKLHGSPQAEIVEIAGTLNLWIHDLADDAALLREVCAESGISREARRLLLGGLVYLLRRIDIIPNHLQGMGLVDDAFVLRVAVSLAQRAGLGDLPTDKAGALLVLAAGTDLIEAFLGDLYRKFAVYVGQLPDVPFRNRTVDQIIDESEARVQFLRELREELRDHRPAPLLAEDRALREIRLFFKNKLGSPGAPAA